MRSTAIQGARRLAQEAILRIPGVGNMIDHLVLTVRDPDQNLIEISEYIR